MEREQGRPRIATLYGLASALLFGAATPFSKLLLRRIDPLMLAALLYIGAAVFVSLYRIYRFVVQRQSREARLRVADAPVLCLIVGFGGVLGPVLMLFGLARISALAGSLLLNLEAVFTILIAVTAFGERLNSGSAAASMSVIGGALLLSYQPGPLHGDVMGAVAIAGACLSWAIDNNLSQRLSIRDPVAVVQIKAAGAGITSLILALISGRVLPTSPQLLESLVLGGVSYGVSLVFVILALRHLGAAREAAWFSTAPFVGAILSIPLFGLLPNTYELIGALLAAAGIFLLIRERHDHLHEHEVLEHDHLHSHDEHHIHQHDSPVTEPHSHPHRHDSMIHEHQHLSDLHHRHRHA